MSRNKEVFWTVLPRFMTIAGIISAEDVDTKKRRAESNAPGLSTV